MDTFACAEKLRVKSEEKLQIAKDSPIEILEQSSYPPHEIAELIRVTRGLSEKTP